MEINKIELLSVGIDVGSASSHLVFSNLVLVRDERSPTLRFNIEERKVIYEGMIIHTPFLVVVVFTLIRDIIYTVIDPRIRFA